MIMVIIMITSFDSQVNGLNPGVSVVCVVCRVRVFPRRAVVGDVDL